MVRDEWDHYWAKFINKEHHSIVEREGNLLLRKFGLRYSDIRDFKTRQAASQKSQSPSATITEQASESQVVASLRILSAIEHLLGPEKGNKATILLAQAKRLAEADKADKEFLAKQDFVDFISEAKDDLQAKLSSATLNEGQARAARTGIDSVTVLLQKTELRPTPRPPALNIEKYGIDPLKLNIAQLIVSHFKNINQELNQSHLDTLVMSEFNRIQDAQSQQHYAQAHPQPPKPSSSSSNLNVNWNAIQSAIAQVQHVPEQAPFVPPREAEVPPEKSGETHDELDDYDDLSIEELTSLFRNFNQLDQGTQSHLIAYMKRLEKTNPVKVTEFKKHLHSSKS